MSASNIERRLAAVLAADVAGFSRLMSADEVGTLLALKVHRRDLVDPAIASHRGRIVKTTGDGVLAEFPSVIDAVACAVSIQRAMRDRNDNVPDEQRIVLRIGINVGDIIIDGDDMFGDGVNMASRLESLCDPGGLVISRYAREQIRGKLSLPFADRSGQTVKNIPSAVGVFGLSAGDIAALPANALPTPEQANPVLRPPRGAAPWITAAVLGLLAAFAGGVWWAMRDEPPKPAPQAAASRTPPPRPFLTSRDRRLSTIVLPFENTSPDAAQEALAVRITRDITDRIATDRSWPLIPTTTPPAERGKPVNVAALGRELDAHFVLTGTVQTRDNRLFVTATLIETATGQPVWSDRYDRPDGPDARTPIVASIHEGVYQAEIDTEVARARRDHPDTLDARDYTLAAMITPLQPVTKDNYLAQIALLDKALTIDPGYFPALLTAARLRIATVQNDWSSNRVADLDLAAQAVDRLIAERARDARVLSTKGMLLRAQGKLDEALAAYRETIQIDPSSVHSRREIGVILHRQGQYQAALESFLEARKRQPAGSPDYLLDSQTAVSALATGRFADAITLARQSISEAASGDGGLSISAWLTLIAAESANGQDGDAKTDLARYLASTTDWRTLTELRRSASYANTPNLIDGLRKAGMAEE